VSLVNSLTKVTGYKHEAAQNHKKLSKNIMKFSQAVNWVKWLNIEKNQCFEGHLCPCPQGADMDMVGKNKSVLFIPVQVLVHG